MFDKKGGESMSLKTTCDYCGKEFERHMTATWYVCPICGSRACAYCGQGKICKSTNRCQVERPRMVKRTGG